VESKKRVRETSLAIALAGHRGCARRYSEIQHPTSSICYQRTDSVAMAETLPVVEHALRIATCWDHPFDSQLDSNR
jgi:hypothetical protein